MIILKNLIIEISNNSIITSINSILLVINMVMLIWFKKIKLIWSLINLITIVIIWLIDILEESCRGNLTNLTKRNLLTGFILFIISEILLFSTLFGIYFYDLLNPSIHISSSWNNLCLLTYNYNGIPLLNVLILFMSGITITISLNILYIYLLWKIENILITILLGILFVFIQYKEYNNSKFTISDSIYSNIFYSLTSLLGLLMIIGIIIILFSLNRIYLYLLITLNLLCGSINLLFLDFCFIFIYIFIYCYGS